MSPFQCTLSKTISQLLNNAEFSAAAEDANCAICRQKPDVTSSYIILSSPDVIYLPETNKNCISLKCTCKKGRKGVHPEQIANMKLAISSFMKTTANMGTDSISFILAFIFFVLTCSESIAVMPFPVY